MSTKLRPINRISISELPETQVVKSTDYLILESDGASVRLQVDNLMLDRSNLNFYNEIADLNILTAQNAAAISAVNSTLTNNLSATEKKLETKIDTNSSQITESTQATKASIKNKADSAKAKADAVKREFDDLIPTLIEITTIKNTASAVLTRFESETFYRLETAVSDIKKLKAQVADLEKKASVNG